MGGIADALDLAQQGRQPGIGGAPAQIQAVVAQVQRRLEHPRHLHQALLDQPAAGGAADAFNQQFDLLTVTLAAHIALLHIAAVEHLQLVLQGLGQGFRVGGIFRAVRIVGFQTTGDDGISYSLAAGAAHGALLAENGAAPGRAGRNRFAAVIAGGGLGHFAVSWCCCPMTRVISPVRRQPSSPGWAGSLRSM